jgi:hypothetical protein
MLVLFCTPLVFWYVIIVSKESDGRIIDETVNWKGFGRERSRHYTDSCLKGLRKLIHMNTSLELYCYTILLSFPQFLQVSLSGSSDFGVVLNVFLLLCVFVSAL